MVEVEVQAEAGAGWQVEETVFDTLGTADDLRPPVRLAVVTKPSSVPINFTLRVVAGAF